MKILTKDKIIEEYQFSLTEALIFAILVWTSWGLAESFYLQKVVPMLDPSNPALHPMIFVEAFLLYVVIAAAMALLLYCAVRLILQFLPGFNPHRFRGMTLTLILLSFLLLSVRHYILARRYGMIAVAVALILSGLFYFWASGLGFRIRRSGTMMLSILVISVLLAVVHFPLFSAETTTYLDDPYSGARQLMGYHYLKPIWNN